MKYSRGKLYTTSQNTSSVKGATIVMCLENYEEEINPIVFDCVVLYSDSDNLNYEKGYKTFELCSRFSCEYVGNLITNNISPK